MTAVLKKASSVVLSAIRLRRTTNPPYRCCERATMANQSNQSISPYPAGSASDTVSRVVLDEVSRLLGQPVVIEMRPGAGGKLALRQWPRSEPDGYTLVTSSSSMATERVLHKTLPYDPVRDFVPVVLIGTSPNVLMVTSLRR